MNRLFYSLALIAVVLIGMPEVHAQHESLCASEHDALVARPAGLEIPTTGEFGALIVYIRFEDHTWNGNCSAGDFDWPWTQDLPTTASHIISRSASPPFADSSMTALFYEQSRGNFVFYGDAYGYVAGPVQDYNDGNDGLNRGKLAKEVFDWLDSLSGFDFNDYDKNNDGYLDHVFFILRSTYPLDLVSWSCCRTASGISSIDFEWDGSKDPARYDSLKISAHYSGSFNKYGGLSPLKGMIGLLVHEFGHDLWNWNGAFSDHLNPIIGNFVPYTYTVAGELHIPPGGSPYYGDPHRYADRVVAYSTMQGGSTPSKVLSGSPPSAFERDLLSLNAASDAERWILCEEVLDGATHTVSDLYTNNDCFKLTLDVGANTEALYFSNMQRHSYFNGYGTTMSANPNGVYPGQCVLIEGGLNTTGLRVELTRRRTTPVNGRYNAVRDIMPADNGLGINAAADIAVGVGATPKEAAWGDFWGPETGAQLSPWTRPNVYGYTFLEDVPANLLAGGWHVIDDIRYGGGVSPADSTMQFEYYADATLLNPFRIRKDSWMATKSDGLVFPGEVRVTNGATLTIEEGVTITFNDGLVVESGATLMTEEGAVLQFGPGARLRVEGALVATGTTFRESDPRQGWAGIDVRPAGSLTVGANTGAPSATFAGSTIEGVELTGLTKQAPAVVSVYSATADFSGTTIQGGMSTVGGAVAGLVVAGKRTEVTVRDGSRIRLNSGIGILAQSDAEVDVRDSEIRENTGSGVMAGSGATVHLFQNQIADNFGYGVHATDYGIVAFSRPHGVGSWPDGFNLVANNDAGGLLADDAGTVVAGMEYWEAGNCLQGCFNDIQDHSWALAPFDAKAAEYGTVWATLNFWGDGVASVADLVLIEETGGIVVVDSVLTAPQTGGRPAGTVVAGAASGDPSGVAERSDSPRLLLRAARAAASEGDYPGAFALLRQVIETAEGDYRRLGYTEALRLLQEEQPPAVMTFLEGVAAGESPYRPWALRALVVGYEAAEQPAQAESAAGTLIESFGGSRHALFGHLARVHLRLGQDDLAGAEAALVGAEAGWPEHPAVASARGLLAWLTDEEGSGARGVGAGEASALRTDGEQAGRSSAAAYRLSAYPNPSVGSATVSLELAARGAARVAVYDVLGREVAVLADRVLEAGRHALPLTGGALPSGTYVVRAEVTEAGGIVRILTQKLVLAR